MFFLRIQHFQHSTLQKSCFQKTFFNLSLMSNAQEEGGKEKPSRASRLKRELCTATVFFRLFTKCIANCICSFIFFPFPSPFPVGPTEQLVLTVYGNGQCNCIVFNVCQLLHSGAIRTSARSILYLWCSNIFTLQCIIKPLLNKSPGLFLSET